jgi:cytochrome c peroxidase
LVKASDAKRATFLAFAASGLHALLLTVGCSQNAASTAPLPAETTPSSIRAPLTPIEAPRGLDPARVALGELLFGETRLSGTGKLACATCHDLSHAGVDHLRASFGVTGQPLSINTPTVFNSALNLRQFWDGRAATLEEQVDGPLLSPSEMGSSWPSVLAKLEANAPLARRFRDVYGHPATPADVRDALATFERSLATPDAPFDRYLKGDSHAVGPDVVHGYELFTSYGCSSCHQGQAVGANIFEQFGVMRDYFADRGHETQADLGRFNVTHDEADRHVFKVPSLRNVARTAPYFHDGSVTRLEDAVRVMGRYQLGREIDDDDDRSIVAFLESLTGLYQGRLP